MSLVKLNARARKLGYKDDGMSNAPNDCRKEAIPAKDEIKEKVHVIDVVQELQPWRSWMKL